MDPDLRLTNIHLEVRESLKKIRSHIGADLRGLDRITFVRAARLDLESDLFVTVDLGNIVGHVLFDDLKVVVGDHLNGTDSPDTEDLLKLSDRSVIVEFFGTRQKDPALLPLNFEALGNTGEILIDPGAERFFKDVPVLALDTDLRVFNQKCTVCHACFLPVDHLYYEPVFRFLTESLIQTSVKYLYLFSFFRFLYLLTFSRTLHKRAPAL